MESEEVKIKKKAENTEFSASDSLEDASLLDSSKDVDTDKRPKVSLDMHDEISVNGRGETQTATLSDTVVEASASRLVEARREVPHSVLAGNRTHVVTADSIEAEEVPTIPLDSLQTINALQPEVAIRPVRATSTVTVPPPLVAQPSEYRRGLGEWVQIWRTGMRLNRLSLSLAPVLLGTAMAWTQTITRTIPFGHFQLQPFISMVIAVLLLQTGAHLVNDYYDYLRGVDTSNTLGPGGLIQEGQIRPANVVIVGLVLLIIGGILALTVAWHGGAVPILLTLLIVLGAYFYSATAYSLGGRGLGELVSFFVFGPLPTIGAYMVQTGGDTQNSRVFIYSLPLGFFAAAVLFANNMRDIEGDEHARKYTLANLMGITLSRIAYIVLLLAAFAIILPQGVMHNSPHLILITLWTFPSLLVAISGVLRTKAPAGFHLLMRQTLRLEIFFVVLLIIALIITAAIPVLPQIQFSILKI